MDIEIPETSFRNAMAVSGFTTFHHGDIVTVLNHAISIVFVQLLSGVKFEQSFKKGNYFDQKQQVPFFYNYYRQFLCFRNSIRYTRL